jgi:hypothetical protein
MKKDAAARIHTMVPQIIQNTFFLIFVAGLQRRYFVEH